MRRHQLQTDWPQLCNFSTQGQLPLVNLDEDNDLNEALDMLCPRECDPHLHFMPSCSAPFSSPHAQTTCVLPEQPTEGQAATFSSQQSLEDPSDMDKKPKRRVGRPRVNEPGGSSIGGAAATAAAGEGKRGPKPKYVFSNPDEAVDARRERNRKAALESYYKKRQKLGALEGEKQLLEAENAALEKLLCGLQQGTTTLPEASDNGINTWLQTHS